MTFDTLSTFELGDTTVLYQIDRGSSRVGLSLYPTALKSEIAVRRENLADTYAIALVGQGWAPRAYTLDSLVHIKLLGDPYASGFSQGRTMRGSPSNDRFRFEAQDVVRDAPMTEVVTTLVSAEGLRITHRLHWKDGDQAAWITTTFANASSDPVTIEMLTSFSLGGITPFDGADASERLKVHRFRSVWSAEGRLDSQSIEQLHMEPSWHSGTAYSERFGQLGTMPVRGWFPFLAAEDTVAGVLWGAQIAWPGSWQMEVYRKEDLICLSGGLADREFGQWMKTIEPGQEFTAPVALIACGCGDIDDLCQRLTAIDPPRPAALPEIEQGLPIAFNEYCTTWGKPTHDRMIALANRLQGSGVKYVVMDAGWYVSQTDPPGPAHGDWVVKHEAFPEGLEAFAGQLRDMGFIPGIWFEMENTGPGSIAFEMTDHLVKRDGIPMTVDGRRFWDLTDPVANQWIDERVFYLLDRCGFGYIKVDYNETIGVVCDGGESPGEGLRLQAAGVHNLFERLAKRLPDLVIENCASGGHRLEPSMLWRSSMSSFSDAHELLEIPIIGANLHRLMPPRQSQIWATLHPADSDRRLVYSLASTFLGRMCLSGGVDELDERQWGIVLGATALYTQAAPVIKCGRSRITHNLGESWRHPKGWQSLTRISEDGKSALVVAHAFEGAPDAIGITLPNNAAWSIAGQLTSAEPAVLSAGSILTMPLEGDFCGRVVLLRS